MWRTVRLPLITMCGFLSDFFLNRFYPSHLPFLASFVFVLFVGGRGHHNSGEGPVRFEGSTGQQSFRLPVQLPGELWP